MNAVTDNFRRSRIKHFVGLIRVSTGKQADDNLSLDVQEQRIRTRISEIGNAELELFCEVDSASKKQTKYARPVLHAAIEAARKNDATLVVVRINRLTRNPDALPFLKGIKIRSLEQGDVSQSRLKELVYEASRESQVISEGSSASAASRRARGEKLGNTKNLDVAQRKGCERNQVRAQRKVVDLADHFRRRPELQKLTHADLCGALNDLGFLNQRNACEQVPWTKDTIRRPRAKAMKILLKE